MLKNQFIGMIHKWPYILCKFSKHNLRANWRIELVQRVEQKSNWKIREGKAAFTLAECHKHPKKWGILTLTAVTHSKGMDMRKDKNPVSFRVSLFWGSAVECLYCFGWQNKITGNEKCSVMDKCQTALTVSSAASVSCDVWDTLPSSIVKGPSFLDLCGNQLYEQPYRLLPEMNMKNALWDSPWMVYYVKYLSVFKHVV